MHDNIPQRFPAAKLRKLSTAFRLGAENSTQALSKWLGRVSSLKKMASIEQRPLKDATSLIETSEPMCFGLMKMPEVLPGHLIVAFDESSGLAITDMVLRQPIGTAKDWGELEKSAALESTNIVCCAYLNVLTTSLDDDSEDIDSENVDSEDVISESGISESGISDGSTPNKKPFRELIPSPPEFRIEFAESLFQFLLMDQAMHANHVFFSKSLFEIEQTPFQWTLFWIPSNDAINRLNQAL